VELVDGGLAVDDAKLAVEKELREVLLQEETDFLAEGREQQPLAQTEVIRDVAQ
jgi:hypothetical protein